MRIMLSVRWSICPISVKRCYAMLIQTQHQVYEASSKKAFTSAVNSGGGCKFSTSVRVPITLSIGIGGRSADPEFQLAYENGTCE